MEHVEFLATGDLHLQPLGSFSRTIDANGETVLSKLIASTAEWIACQVPEEGFLLLNGDLTDTPGVLTAAALRLMREVEERFDAHDVLRVYNRGNHDMDGKNPGLSNLEMYSLLDRVFISKAPRDPLIFSHRGGPRLWVIPYTHSQVEQEELLACIPDNELVAIHYPVIGARMNPIVAGESDTREERGLEPSALARFRVTLLSHYHLPQIYVPDSPDPIVVLEGFSDAIPSGSIIAMGTPLAHSFSDRHVAYGVWKIQADASQVRASFLTNPYSPRFVVVRDEDREGIEEALRQVQSLGGVKRSVFLSVDTTDPELAASLRENPPVSEGIELLDYRVRASKVRPQPVGQERPKISATENVMAAVLRFLDHDTETRKLFVPLDREKVIEYLAPRIDNLPVQVDAIGGEVQFGLLEIHNFLSWEDATVPLGGSGLVLVRGSNQDTTHADSNGAGKTSLLESILWCLYGKTFREVEYADEVIRHGSSGGCEVKVGFATGEGAFRVRRYRKTTEGTGVVLERERDLSWENVSTQDVQGQIVRALGIPFSLFTATVFFGSRFQNCFSEMGDAERKRFLSMVLSLDSYALLRDDVKSDVSEVSLASERAKAQLVIKTEAVQTADAKLAEARQKAEQEAVEKARVLAEVGDRLSQARRTKETADAEATQASEAISEQKTLVESLRRQAEAGRSQVGQLEFRIQAARASVQEWGQAKSRAVRRLQSINQQLTNIASDCPTCGQPLPPERIESVREGFAAQVDEAGQEMVAASSNAQKFEAEIQGLQSELSALQTVDPRIGIALSQAEDRRRNLESAEKSAKERVRTSTDAVVSLERLEATWQSRDPFVGIPLVEKVLSEAQEARDSYQSMVSELEARERFVKGVHELLGPKALVSFLLDSLVEELNQHLARYAPLIFGDDCQVQISSTKETKKGEDNRIVVEVTTLGGKYGSSSDGEQRKVDIALHLALGAMLRQSGRGTANLLIGDQVFDNSLDLTAARSVIEALGTFAADEAKRVFMISHSVGIAPFVQESIEVERRGGISRILN